MASNSGELVVSTAARWSVRDEKSEVSCGGVGTTTLDDVETTEQSPWWLERRNSPKDVSGACCSC